MVWNEHIVKGHKQYHCPECGAEMDRLVIVGMRGIEMGPLYYCGTIYCPSIEQITVRGVCCKIICNLRNNLFDCASRGLVLAECYIEHGFDTREERSRFRLNNDNYIALSDYAKRIADE